MTSRFVNEFIDSLFPMSPEGFNFDLFVSNADVTNYNLEAITVPTLIAHTKDDQLASHDASQRAAERIPALDSSASNREATSCSVNRRRAAKNSPTSLPRGGIAARSGWHLERRRPGCSARLRCRVERET